MDIAARRSPVLRSSAIIGHTRLDTRLEVSESIWPASRMSLSLCLRNSSNVRFSLTGEYVCFERETKHLLIKIRAVTIPRET